MTGPAPSDLSSDTTRTGPRSVRVVSGLADWLLPPRVGDDGVVRRFLATLALVAVLVLGALAGGAAPATAQSDGQVTTTFPTGGDIIPQPGTGTEPEDAGDRGGALQTALFFGIVGAVVVMGAVVVRQSRKARAERGF